MPGYGGSGQAKLVRDNQQVFLFQNEIVVAGRASIAIQLERINRSYYPWGVSFQIYFTASDGVTPADPGAFEVDIQTSDIDTDLHYCLTNSLVGDASLNSNFSGRIEMPNFYAKYVRALVKTQPNTLYTTVLATH
jgi:hypothetical protein